MSDNGDRKDEEERWNIIAAITLGESIYELRMGRNWGKIKPGSVKARNHIAQRREKAPSLTQASSKSQNLFFTAELECNLIML